MGPRNISFALIAASMIFCFFLLNSIILPRLNWCSSEQPGYRAFEKRHKEIIVPFTGFRFQPHVKRNKNVDWNTVSASSLTGPQIVDYFLWSNQSSCLLSHDFGGKMFFNPSGLDGQKAVCLDPVQVAPQPGKCIVYSFGINNDWSFDEAMERFGCEVYAFDPSIEKDDHDHTEGIHFYNMGLGRKIETDEEYGWKIMTLSAIYEKLGHAHKNNKFIDYLKMDIELEEWGVLLEILDSGMMSKVRQLAVEFHLLENESLQTYRNFAKILQRIEREGNMTRFDSKYNPWFMGHFNEFGITGSFGYEIAWYNSNFL